LAVVALRMQPVVIRNLKNLLQRVVQAGEIGTPLVESQMKREVQEAVEVMPQVLRREEL
jgi:hypothetical protein